MNLFASARERLYWTSAIIAQLLIYSTLGVQAELAKYIRSLGLIEVLYLIGFIIIIVVIPILGIINRFHWSKIILAIGLFSIISFGISRIGLAEERTHLIEYAFIGSLVYLAIEERSKVVTSLRKPLILAIIIAGALGLLDECLQYFIPQRVFDFRDILFNLLASTGSILLVFMVKKKWAY